MKLVWHIAKKDLRRMAWPVVLWVGFIVGSTVLFRFASSGERVGPGEAGAWVETMRIWVRLEVVGGLFVGYLLTGALVLEDELIGTTGFWLTRPIAGGRLLKAKVAAASLLFIAAPTLALVPVWLGCGLGLAQTAGAAGEFAMWQGAATLLALGISSLASSLARFLFYTIALAAAYSACSFGSAWTGETMSRSIFWSRELLVEGGLLLTITLVLAWQYRTRRVAWAWITIGLALMASFTIRVAWPWDVCSGIAARADQWRFDDRAEDRAAQIVVAPSLSAWDDLRGQAVTMKVTASWTKDGSYMPMLAKLDDVSGAIFKVAGGWHQLAEWAVGFSSGGRPIVWSLTTWPSTSDRRPSESTRVLTGKLELWAVRSTVLGEMPLREGGELSSGATRTRIVGFQHTGEQLDGIFIEEHDATLELIEDTPTQGESWPNPKARYFDCFILVDRAKRRVQPLSWGEMGAVRMNALSTWVRRLSVSGTESWEGAVVVQVRIECDHSFTRPFEVKGVVFENKGTTL